MTDNELTTLCEAFDLMYAYLTDQPASIQDIFTKDEYKVISESRELVDEFYGDTE